MSAFSEHRRSPPALNQIRPGMGASCSAVRRLEERSEEVGIKRRILFHGILEAGPRATAVEIWKTLGRLLEHGHAPSQGGDPTQSESFCRTRHPAPGCHARSSVVLQRGA